MLSFRVLRDRTERNQTLVLTHIPGIIGKLSRPQSAVFFLVHPALQTTVAPPFDPGLS